MSNRGDEPDEQDEGDFGEDEMFTQRERYGAGDRRRPRVVTDFVRRAIENTVGSVGVGGSISRDTLNYLLQQGDRGKRELVRIVGHEVGEFLRNVDLSSEVIKVLTSVQVDVNASIRFRPTKDGVKPEVGVDANLTGARDARDPQPTDGAPELDPAEATRTADVEKKE
ncbi:hypothetical protein L6R52_25585 [Myxococcota bacterium]|nr:hypothetical protein [Myxococcota bacterium]